MYETKISINVTRIDIYEKEPIANLKNEKIK